MTYGPRAGGGAAAGQGPRLWLQGQRGLVRLMRTRRYCATGGSRRVIRSNSSVSGSPTSRPNSVSP